jgi:N-methylhydantoinase A
MNLRVAAEVPVTGAGAPAPAEAGAGHDAAPPRRAVWWQEAGGYVDTPVYPRTALVPGRAYRGPAVVEEEGSTLVVGPAAEFRVLASGNLRVDLDPGGEDAP